MTFLMGHVCNVLSGGHGSHSEVLKMSDRECTDVLFGAPGLLS